MNELVIATRNAHKAVEIRSILGPGWRCRTLGDFPNTPELVEDADSFGGNATKKAVALAAWLASSNPESVELVLADDSGLEVNALHGAPGVHSARFAAPDIGATGNSPDAANNAKLLRLLTGVPAAKRIARFRCCLALTPVRSKAESQRIELFEGICEGRIGFEPHGRNGFGYDPLFVPEGYGLTFAELGEEVKNQISHRSRALAKLKAWLDHAR